MRISALISCVAIALSFPFAVAADATDEYDTVRTSAKAIERPPPRYPRNKLMRGQQGWVDLSYVVDPAGDVVDPIVIASSGSQFFEQAAKEAALKFKYEPATIDGKPVQQCETKVRISFAIEGESTMVTRSFYNRYRKIERALDHDEVGKADALIDKAFESKMLTLAEIAWLWTARTRVLGKLGKKDEQLVAVKRATSNPHWIEDDLYANLLIVRTTLEIEKGLYADAIRSYDLLEKTELQNTRTDRLAAAIAKVKDFFATDQVVSVRARINATDDCDDCAPNWQYDPLRRQFSFANVNGTLRKVEVRCDWNRFIDAIDPDSNDVWQLPQSWGNCSVFVFGEPGTTFEFYEVPPDHRSAN